MTPAELAYLCLVGAAFIGFLVIFWRWTRDEVRRTEEFLRELERSDRIRRIEDLVRGMR